MFRRLHALNKGVNEMKREKEWMIVTVSLVMLGVIIFAKAEPIGPYVISNITETADLVTDGLLMNHTKGKITTALFNVTQPNEDWKGYVGNVTGKLVLWDSTNYSLFDWTFATIDGEVYASRSDSITWTTVSCADSTHVATEDTFLNHIATQPDRINETFNNATHPEFFVGSTQFASDDCSFSLYTYTNNTLEGKAFSEVLIYDTTGSNLIYAALMNDSTLGFDEKNYDFQMIVGEDSSNSANLGYYFYAEVG